MTARPCSGDPRVALWFAYFQGSHAAARRRAAVGDEFGADLALARGRVRQHAARLLRDARSVDDAAEAMLIEARRHAVIVWPLLGVDHFETGREYTRARTWQDCAHALNPELPTVQPRQWRGEWRAQGQ